MTRAINFLSVALVLIIASGCATHPLKPSVARAGVMVPSPPAQAKQQITFEGQTNVVYFVVSTDDLINPDWRFPEVVFGRDGTNTVYVERHGQSSYYRVRAQ